MVQSKSSGHQNRQSGTVESDSKTSDTKTSQEKSSKNEKSRTKAGKDEGAGGGAKQKQKH